ncbi:MAG: hypothetical protein ACP5KS_13105, partial [Candidatus Hydrogenedens sp.]
FLYVSKKKATAKFAVALPFNAVLESVCIGMECFYPNCSVQQFFSGYSIFAFQYHFPFLL